MYQNIVGSPVPIQTEAPGICINSYSINSGQKANLVLVNAVGMSAEVFHKLILALQDNYNIYTWETRRPPEGYEDSHQSWVAGSLVEDMWRVFSHYSISSAHIVGWCSGARVAITFANRFPKFCLSLSLLNGALICSAYKNLTDYEETMRRVIPRIANKREYAYLYHKLFYLNEKKSEDLSVDQGENLLFSSDAELSHISNYPYQNAERLFYFAKSVNSFFEAFDNSSIEINGPALLLTGSEDLTTSPEASASVAQTTSEAQYRCLPGAGHFMLYHNAVEVADHIRRFIGSVSEHG